METAYYLTKLSFNLVGLYDNSPPPSQAYETISMAHKHSAEGRDFLDFYSKKIM